MSPSILRIPSDGKLPQRADAVVIGGGIVGVSTAYFLAKRGLSVAVVEKGYIGGEQSSRNWGWCRQQNRDVRELPVFTEQGLIRTGAVVCAGGAWASGFCRRHGISFPQASVRASVLRTPPIEGLAPALATPECTLTRRPDGGYIVAISGKGTLELTPQGLRYARDFMPMFVKRLKAVEIGVGRSFFRGPEALNRWEFDEESPFEQIRVLDPAPDQKAIRYLVDRFKRLYPALPGIKVSQAWGSYIDSTPDAVPVISPVDRIKGFVLAAGFSGHGFGLGPGAGQLAASMVSGEQPPVVPTPFRFSRFGDGSKVKVGAI